ncbi:hypothetical protein GQ42DRAFT_164022 [Ramicandelaber brevisporus]|nr:hypothetical protein GQ42DRAFT_164022 [Ramicandelaber brevisporus]
MSTKPTTSTTAAGGKKLSEQDIVNEFSTKRSDLQQLAQTITKLSNDLEEHRLVLKTLTEVKSKPAVRIGDREVSGGERKCSQLVNGVLVQRTVDEVLPEISTKVKEHAALVERYKQEFEKKEADLAEYQKKHNIRIMPANSAGGGGGGGGVATA